MSRPPLTSSLSFKEKWCPANCARAIQASGLYEASVLAAGRGAGAALVACTKLHLGASGGGGDFPAAQEAWPPTL